MHASHAKADRVVSSKTAYTIYTVTNDVDHLATGISSRIARIRWVARATADVVS